MTKSQLLQLSRIDAADEERTDLRTVQVDTELPAASRAEEFLRQVKNPYTFKCGELTVDVRYTAGGKELEEALVSYLGAIKGES